MRKIIAVSLSLVLTMSAAAQTSTQDAKQATQSDVSQGNASNVRRISIDEAVDLAIKNNLTLESAGLTLDKARRQSDLFWNQFLPTASVGGAISRMNTTTMHNLPQSVQVMTSPTEGYMKRTDGDPITIEDAIKRGSLGAQVSVGWSGTNMLNFGLFAGIKTLKQQYAAGQITFEKAKVQLNRDVRKLYLRLLLLGEQLKVQESGLDMAVQRVKMAEANYRAGLSPQLIWLQAQVNRDNLIPQVDQVRDAIKVQEANLAMLLGLPYDTDFELDAIDFGNFDIPLDVQDLITKASSSKPDIMELRAQILTQKSALKAQKIMQWTPSIGFTWSWSPAFIDDPWGYGRNVKKSKYWNDNGSFSLSLAWSLNALLPFTTQGVTISNTENDVKISEIGLAQMIRGEEVNIYNTVFTLKQSRDSMAAGKSSVSLAERSYQLTRQAFNNGLQDSQSMLDAEQQLQQARLNVLMKQFDFLTGIIDLEYSIGVPFGTMMSKK